MPLESPFCDLFGCYSGPTHRYIWFYLMMPLNFADKSRIVIRNVLRENRNVIVIQ